MMISRVALHNQTEPEQITPLAYPEVPQFLAAPYR